VGWVDPTPIGGVNNCKRSHISRLEAIMPEGEPLTVEELSGRSGLETGALLAELSKLELAGRILRIRGAGFVRVDNSAIGGGNG